MVRVTERWSSWPSRLPKPDRRTHAYVHVHTAPSHGNSYLSPTTSHGQSSPVRSVDEHVKSHAAQVCVCWMLLLLASAADVKSHAAKVCLLLASAAAIAYAAFRRSSCASVAGFCYLPLLLASIAHVKLYAPRCASSRCWIHTTTTSRQLLPESRDRDRLWLEEEEEELILKRRRRGRRKRRRRGGSGGGGTRGEKEDHGQARSTHCSDRSLH